MDDLSDYSGSSEPEDNFCSHIYEGQDPSSGTEDGGGDGGDGFGSGLYESDEDRLLHGYDSQDSQDDHGPPQGHNPYDHQDSEDDDSESEDQSSDEGNGLIDLEAEESGNDSDEDGENSEEVGGDRNVHGGYYSDGESVTEDFDFPQFKRLPPELREHIWTFFCPDLNKSQCRLLQFWINKNEGGGFNYAFVGLGMEDATRQLRVLGAVYRESRAIGLRAYPDRLDFLHDRNKVPQASLMFNKETDVIYVDDEWNPRGHPNWRIHEVESTELPGFTNVIQNLAYAVESAIDFSRFSEWLKSWKAKNLKNLYLSAICAPIDLDADEGDLAIREDYCRPIHSMWCGSPLVNRFKFGSERRSRLDGQYLATFCWPDLVKNRAFAESEVRDRLPHLMARSESLAREVNSDGEDEDGDEESPAVTNMKEILGEVQANLDPGVEVWPMVCFENVSGSERLKDLCEHYGDPGFKVRLEHEEFDDEMRALMGHLGHADSDDDSLGSLEDFIETEDEDDDPVDAVVDSSEDFSGDEDDLHIQGGDLEDGGMNEDHEEPFEGFSSVDEVDGDVLTNGHNGTAQYGNFSSPEAAPINGDAHDESEEDGGSPVVAASKSRKRRVVESDSEGEDDEDATPKPKRSRIFGGRPTRGMESDSDE